MTTTLVRLVAIAALAAVSSSTAFAAAPQRSDSNAAAARTPSEAQAKQQSRMASCNQDAAGKKGDERKAFMKQCLSASSAKAARAAPADGSGKASRRKAAQ